MKKFIYLFSTLFLISFATFQSCKKDKEITKNNQISNSNSRGFLSPDFASPYVPDLDDCLEGVSLYNGYIRFTSYEAFRNTFLCLSEKDSMMEKSFLDNWGYIQDDSLLNYIEDTLGYNIEGAYEEFESNFEYTSLRSVMVGLEEEWSESLPLDTNNYPEHVIGNRELQTLLDNNGIFIIADTIYKFEKEGSHYQIKGLFFSALDSIVEQGRYYGNNTNVIYKKNFFSRDTCRGYGSSGTTWHDKGKFTTGVRCYYYNVGPISVAAATTISRKYAGGKAKLYRTSMRAIAGGTRWNSTALGNCGDNSVQYLNPYKEQRKKRWTRSHLWFYKSRWESCRHEGDHYTGTFGQTILTCVSY